MRYYAYVMMLTLQPTIAINRTTLVLPTLLKQLATERARSEGISFGEFVRRAIEKQLVTPANKTGDPFWDNLTAYEAEGPTDIAQNHDDYLYGEKP